MQNLLHIFDKYLLFVAVVKCLIAPYIHTAVGLSPHLQIMSPSVGKIPGNSADVTNYLLSCVKLQYGASLIVCALPPDRG